MATLRLILGDQLHSSHSWCIAPVPDTTIVMMEVRSETDYVHHHIQKVACIFAAMRAFAEELRSRGHHVHYISINDPENLQSITRNLLHLIQTKGFTRVEYLEPDEWRVEQELRTMAASIKTPVRSYTTEHFYTDRYDLREKFGVKSRYVMENFYRWMRKRFNILMEDDGVHPVGGKWNYDVLNRNKWKGDHQLPPPWNPQNNLTHIVEEIHTAGITTIGTIDAENVPWPINRTQALHQLDWFVEHALPLFGRYQDAMVYLPHPTSWSLYHSRLSFALNTKMLTAQEVVERVIAWWKTKGDIESLASAEGFIRQILGWREYVRGIYWSEMPGYTALNVLEHNNPLPSWYWTGETRMLCVSEAIKQSLDYAYAHHIQRLMITGVFALLAGVNPAAVDAWYLGIYIDAFEWVELPNVRGMSQWADGGKVSTKPYACSGNYINKMSNYCSSCEYNVKTRVEEDSCPFNALYWYFLHTNYKHVRSNERTSAMMATLYKMKEQDRLDTFKRARWVLEHIEEI